MCEPVRASDVTEQAASKNKHLSAHSKFFLTSMLSWEPSRLARGGEPEHVNATDTLSSRTASGYAASHLLYPLVTSIIHIIGHTRFTLHHDENVEAVPD